MRMVMDNNSKESKKDQRPATSKSPDPTLIKNLRCEKVLKLQSLKTKRTTATTVLYLVKIRRLDKQFANKPSQGSFKLLNLQVR
jgi:hypothetical protein